MLLDSTICILCFFLIDSVAVSFIFNECSMKWMQRISFLYLLVIIVLLQLQRVHSDIVTLRLPELLTLSEFFWLIFYDLLLNLHQSKSTSPSLSSSFICTGIWDNFSVLSSFLTGAGFFVLAKKLEKSV